MKRWVPVLLITFSAVPNSVFSQQQAVATPDMMEQAMVTAKVAGICSGYEKLFAYAESSRKKEIKDFVKDFFSKSASEIGRTPQGLLELCKTNSATLTKLHEVISRYK